MEIEGKNELCCANLKKEKKRKLNLQGVGNGICWKKVKQVGPSLMAETVKILNRLKGDYRLFCSLIFLFEWQSIQMVDIFIGVNLETQFASPREVAV